MRQKGGWEEEWGMRLMVGRMIGGFLSSKESEMKMRKKKVEKKFTFIDLFAGCGGLMEFSLQ